MTSREDLDKLFEAALHEKSAPSRFGTPESQMKAAPAAFAKQAAAQQAPASALQAAPAQGDGSAPAQLRSPQAVVAQEPSAPVGSSQVEASGKKDSGLIDIAAVGDPFAQQALKSMDNALSDELGAILDAKVAKEKRKKRQGRIVFAGMLLGLTGGSAAWVVTNPERFEAMKQVVAEIKSAGDIPGLVAQYQEALDKIAVRGDQINAATESMGVDPSSADHIEDQGFDKEMREMMGEDGGRTTAQRDKLLREKFKSVEETGSLMNAGEE